MTSCAYVPVSGVRTQSEERPLRDFLDLRESLRERRIGSGGRDVCLALTASLDAAVASLAARFAHSHLAVVAVGGYGRSELSPYSDVDLMILHDAEDPTEAAPAVFRPLWDAGLRLGHSVRNVRQAARAARDRFDTYTTLLTGRCVVGDEELFDRLTGEVASVTRARPLRRYLVAEELERRRRSPYLEMAVDVKTGRGGLRTLHGFEWERRREALIGRFSAEPDPAEDVARETLLTVRNALHVAARRRQDAYSFDLREAVARWLDTDVYEVGERLVDAMHIVDRLANRRWPELIDDSGGLARRVGKRLGGNDEPSRDPVSAEEFASIVRSGEHGRLTLQRLRESGRLADILPEWYDLDACPQLAPFHEHPVDAHLWRTVDEMQAIVEGEGHYAAIAAEVDAPDVLTLAAFLHDIGKGRGGDHAERGAGIARSFCTRLGVDPSSSAIVEGAVRHHLLLSETATRRDLDDPAVIRRVTETVGDLRLLQVIYLLTVADSRATGATMWNDWKGTLVRTLFVRCAALFEADRPDGSAGGTTQEAVLAGVGEDRVIGVRAHLTGMPDEYLRSTPREEVLWHVELIDGLTGHSQLGVRSGGAADVAVVVGPGRRDFRRLVAESFAANGIDVLEARMTSRSDGTIVDTFHVRDDRTAGHVPSSRWERVRADIEAALAGDLDTESMVAARAEAYASVTAVGIRPEVTVTVGEGPEGGSITIKCPDRIGRLAGILTVLGACGLEIRLAKLDSRGGEVVDTFHVRGDGLPPASPEREQLERHIEASISI